jgi:hypothetical protein
MTITRFRSAYARWRSLSKKLWPAVLRGASAREHGARFQHASIRRSSSAVATSRKGHRTLRSGREGQHRRWGRERWGYSAPKWTSAAVAAVEKDVPNPEDLLTN